MTGVLVVCHANICRSPLAAAALVTSAPLEAAGVASRGTDAVAGAGLCVVSASTATSLDIPVDATHRSERLTVQAIADSDLILTAEVAQRAAVGRLLPDARPRTFTIREAVILAGHLESLGRGPYSRISELADALNDARGLSDPTDDLDLIDGHGLSARRHRAATTAVGNAALQFAGLADRLLAARLHG